MIEPAYLYVHDLRASGVVRNAIAIAERIARDRPTTLIAGHGDGLFRTEAEGRGFALAVLGPHDTGRIGAALRLRRWLQGRPSGVLLSAGNHGHRSVWLAARGLPHPRIYRISNELVRDDRIGSLWRRGWAATLVRDAAQIAVVGAALAEVPVLRNAIAAGRGITIANGIDTDRARERAAAPCPHPWLKDEVPVVLGIGRLRPQKDFDLLIAGVAEARRTRRLRLALLGGGTAEESARLTTLAAAHGLGEDFALAGETDNVFAWLSRARVFCLSSAWEGSSMALLEALAVGTPVVAARGAGDAARVLDEGRYGVLFGERTPQAVAAALLVQTSATPIRPHDRARDYAVSVDAYAQLVADVASARAC